ncbi:Mus81p [Sporobolomyces koalae]|uniref:Mus81p n=1 Tax=Sporobolomyces koalae TaxID=500713 RepID=UPI003171EF78
MGPRKAPAGNPDWVEWVEQLVEKNEEIGSKAANSYKKAAWSLKSCPITFTHPDQALQLDGVGPKVVAHIKRQLEKQCQARGIPVPDLGPSPVKNPRKAPAAAARKKRSAEDDEAAEEAMREARRRKAMGLGPDLDAIHQYGFEGLPQELDAPAMEENGCVPGKARAKGKREYLPKQQSGAYAILIALYKNASYDEHSVSTLKSQIIQDATPHCSTPFDRPTAMKDGQRTAGSMYTYTAWSSMATLTAKKLVIAEARVPARFHLSEEGYQLAERLVESAGLARHTNHPSSSSNGHPSSSGLGRHPSSSGFDAGVAGSSYQSGNGSAPFRGTGQTLGGRSAPLHQNFLRRRSPTPPLFLEEETEIDEDQDFDRDMRRAIQLSRTDNGEAENPVARIARQAAMRGNASSSSGPSRSGPLSDGPSGFRPAGAPSSGLNPRKVATGFVARPSSASGPSEAPSIANVDNAFGYYYLDENDSRTKNRAEAEVSQSEDHSMLYRIEYRVAQDLHPMVRGLSKETALTRKVPLGGGKTKSAYIKERVSNETAPGFPESSLLAARPASKAQDKRPSDDPFSSLLAGFDNPAPRKPKDAIYQPPPDVRRLGAAAIDPFAQAEFVLPPALKRSRTLDAPPHQAVAGSSGLQQKSISQPEPPAVPPRSRTLVDSPPRRPTATATTATSIRSKEPMVIPHTSAQNPLQACFERVPGQLVVNRHPLDPVRDSFSTIEHDFPPFEPIVWPVGSFKVYLVVDTREGTREAGRRVELFESMVGRGVRADRKMLPLGDMIWVARRVDQAGVPIPNTEDVVLDAIVERKRLDDLVKSIIDGRYLAQKLRLKDSGISHRIYLIEKYEDPDKYERFGKAIWTCKSQLQVNDGFYVHESANIDDTINYLRQRTQVMAELYEPYELRIIPDRMIERHSYLALQQHLRSTRPRDRYLTTYGTFAELNKPDATLTLRVQWASMVQRIQGMSAEKAVQFLNRWPTLVQFFEEAKKWELEVEEENANFDRDQASTTANRAKSKRRKKEDFVVNNLEDVGTRGIKGKLGERIWDVLMTKDKYTG